MDNFFHISTIYLILLFFFPGFISLKIYDLLVPNEKRNFSQEFLDAISYSILNFGLLIFILIPAYYFKLLENVWSFCILAFLTLIIFPTLWPILICKIPPQYAKWFMPPAKRLWDWFFLQKQCVWVIVNLKNGGKIGGIFATNSYASSFPLKEQLYLEKVWKLNDKGEFECPIKASKGVILVGDEILSLEFFNNKDIMYEKNQKTWIPRFLEQGYRPVGELDTKNPPKGGSGLVPPPHPPVQSR